MLGNRIKNPQSYFCTLRTFFMKINEVIRSFSFVLKKGGKMYWLGENQNILQKIQIQNEQKYGQ